MEKGRDASRASGAGTSGARLFLIVKIAGLVIAVLLIGILIWVKYTFYASRFTPTELDSGEQKVLDAKLARLHDSAEKVRSDEEEELRDPYPALKSERYTEEEASRDIRLTEKELNSLIANDPTVAERVAIHLSDDLVSAKLVIPMDEELPVLGGKTLRLNLGITLGYKEDQLIVALKGVSVGGVPLPNAWLGNLKGINLVQEFGDEGGFWQLFAEGVENISVRNGRLEIRLKE